MALSILLLFEIIIVFSFIVSSIFMFLPKKNDTVHKIFFALSVMLAIFITIINATSYPSNYTTQIIIAWCFSVPAAIGIIIASAKGKPNAFAKLMVMLTSVLGCLSYQLM